MTQNPPYRPPEVQARIRRMGLGLAVLIVMLMGVSIAYIVHCSRL